MITGAIIKILLTVIGLILTPIDLLIGAVIPNFDTVITSIVAFFDYLTIFVGWFLSALGINSIVTGLVVGYWAFALTVPALAWLIKLALKWYHAVKG